MMNTSSQDETSSQGTNASGDDLSSAQEATSDPVPAGSVSEGTGADICASVVADLST
jgi:hypothetical protein